MLDCEFLKDGDFIICSLVQPGPACYGAWNLVGTDLKIKNKIRKTWCADIRCVALAFVESLGSVK